MQESELHYLFNRRNGNTLSKLSLCSHSSAKKASLVATVAFDSPLSIKKDFGNEREVMSAYKEVS